jgi:hypothetical protein
MSAAPTALGNFIAKLPITQALRPGLNCVAALALKKKRLGQSSRYEEASGSKCEPELQGLHITSGI